MLLAAAAVAHLLAVAAVVAVYVLLRRDALAFGDTTAIAALATVVGVCLWLSWKGARGNPRLLLLGNAATAVVALWASVGLAWVPPLVLPASVALLVVLLFILQLGRIGHVLALSRAIRPDRHGYGVEVASVPDVELSPGERHALALLVGRGYAVLGDLDMRPVSPWATRYLLASDGTVIAEVTIGIQASVALAAPPVSYESLFEAGRLRLQTTERAALPRPPGHLVQCLGDSDPVALLAAHTDGCAVLAAHGLPPDRLDVGVAWMAILDDIATTHELVARHPLRALVALLRYDRKGSHSLGLIRERPGEIEAARAGKDR